MGFEIQGLDALMRELEQIAEAISGRIADDALQAGAQPILDEMQRQASIDPKIRTGNLHRAIKVGNIRGKAYKKQITIGTHRQDMEVYAPHVHLVEYGHGGEAPAPPHPFVRPAFDKKSNEAYSEMRRVLDEGLERIVKR